MSCPPSVPKTVFFDFEDGYAKGPCLSWKPGWPTKSTYPTKDNIRWRSGCTSVKMIKNWRGPTTYSNAYVDFSSSPHDIYSLTGGYYVRRRRGRASHGVFYGGPGGIGGKLEGAFWVNSSGMANSNVYRQYLVDQTKTEALAKVADGKLQALESLAEADQTIAMLAETLLRAARALRAARKGDLSGLAKALNPLAKQPGFKPGKSVKGGRFGGSSGNLEDLWLQYQYGWRPLLSDVYAVAELVEEGLRKKGQIHSVWADARDNLDPTKIRSKPPGMVIWEHSGTIEIFSKTQYYFRISQPWIATLESCGVLNPALLAWNLIPYSFVVDWFLSIGTWLQTLSATLGTEYLGGYTTFGVRVSESLKWLDEPYLCGSLPNAQLKVKQFQRTAHPTWAAGTIYVKNPFSNVNRVFSALALIAQARR